MDEDLPIVDAHHHLWDLESAMRYPWLESGELLTTPGSLMYS